MAAQVSNKLTGLTRTRRDQLLEEYVRGIKEGDPHSDQPAHAMRVRPRVSLWPLSSASTCCSGASSATVLSDVLVARQGQLRAVWYHTVRPEDYKAIRKGDFPCQVRLGQRAVAVSS